MSKYMQANQEELEGLPAEDTGGAAKMDAHVQKPKAMLMPGQATPALEYVNHKSGVKAVSAEQTFRILLKANHHGMPCVTESSSRHPQDLYSLHALPPGLSESGWATIIACLDPGSRLRIQCAQIAAYGCRL